MMFAAALLMSSCGLYSKYERPDVNTDGVIRQWTDGADSLLVNDTTSFGNLPWRQVFTDPLLQALIQQGLDHNVNMLNAALNVKMVEEQLKVAKLAFVPQFTFTPQASISSWDFGKATQTYSLPINASWSIDLFGNLLNQKRSTQMALLATKDYQVVVKTQLVCNIANLYYTLLMLDRQQEIIDDMAALTKDTWDMMKLQMELGRYRSTSVQSAEAAYYNVLAQAEDMKRQICETENALSILIGQPAQGIARGNFKDQELPSEFSTGVEMQLLANRADIHYAEMTFLSKYHHQRKWRLYQQPRHDSQPRKDTGIGCGITGTAYLHERTADRRPTRCRDEIPAGIQHMAKRHITGWQRGKQRTREIQCQQSQERT